MTTWCVACQLDHAVAPTRYCPTCLALELAANEAEATVLVIEPHPYDVHIEIMRLAYPLDPVSGVSTVSN